MIGVQYVFTFIQSFYTLLDKVKSSATPLNSLNQPKPQLCSYEQLYLTVNES